MQTQLSLFEDDIEVRSDIKRRGGTLLKNNTLQVGFGKLLSLVRSQLQELQVRGQRGKVSELRARVSYRFSHELGFLWRRLPDN